MSPTQPCRVRRGRRRAVALASALALGAATLAVTVWALGPAVLLAAGAFLVVEDTVAPGSADAIVVLGGDWKGRIDRAVELYRRGVAPRLVVSGGRPVGPELTEARYLAELAVRRGVPRGALLLEERSYSTWTNALQVRELARELGLRRLVVVTSDWHSRRARWTFQRVLGPDGVRVLSAPSPEWRFSLRRWWQSPEGGETVLLEYVRLLWYVVRRPGAPAPAAPQPAAGPAAPAGGGEV